MRHDYRIIGWLAPSTGSICAGQAAQHAPDRWLKPHRTGGSAAPEYSEETLYYKDGTEKGIRVTMADGATVNWRKVSSSSDMSPAVDIDIERSNAHGALVTQKIHFTKR